MKTIRLTMAQALVRYLAAHAPTERSALQTAEIARRLMRGAPLHMDAE